MKKMIPVLSILCLFIISTAASGDETVIFSKIFTRVKGKPVNAVETFSGNVGLALISVTNGGTEQIKRKMVKGSMVKLNGETIFGPHDFKKHIPYLERDVYLDGSNVLEVRLKGRAGGEILVQVKQNVTSSLTVLMDGAGSGRVTSSPGGIFCERDCLEAYESGTPVTLTASPYSNNTFSGWSGGGCSGTAPCTLTIGGNMSVTATFDLDVSGPFSLVTPFVDESDMMEIRNIFRTLYTPPWEQIHDGLDIYPAGDLKPYRAACSGRVQRVVAFPGGVAIIIACDPTYAIEYTFEPQAPDTELFQRDQILIDEGDTVTQGQVIGYLFDANPGSAHVHFTLDENTVPICPEPYFSLADKNAIENLILAVLDHNYICTGPTFSPTPLFTPYVDDSDMKEIRVGFSSEYSTSPWGFPHDGIDIYPKGDLKPFQAACAGTVDSLELRRSGEDSNWLVDLLIECDDYVDDPLDGGYFIPFSVNYVFRTMSHKKKDGKIQRNNIMVSQGQHLSQGDLIGEFHDAAPGDSHVHFGLVQYGSSFFTSLGVTGIPLCPGPHFSAEANSSALNLLHAVWPSASLCYQE